MVEHKNGLILGCIVVALLVGFPLFIKLGTNVMNLMVMLFIYIILAQSWNIIAGFALQVHLGLAAFFGCGVFVTHILWERGVPIYIATAAGALASVILSGIIGLPTLRLRGMYFCIGTLALSETLRITVGNVFPTTMYMPPSYAINYNLLPRYYFALIVMVITCVVVALLAKSKLGLALMALGDDEDAAQVTGVDTFKYKVIAMVLCALFAGLAGGVYAYFRISMLPFYAFVPLWSFEPLVATAIGGMGTLIGPIIGSFILVILSDIFALTLGEAHLIIFGILFILVVLYFPYGIVGSFYRIWMILGRLFATKWRTRES
jgi:branched-chain amino acid transport system permease protein